MSSLRVQLPWQRSGLGVGTTRRHSRVNAAIFHQQQEEAVDDEEDDQQLRLEVPGLASLQREPPGQAEGDHPTVHAHAPGGERGGRGGGEGARRGGGGPREGDLDMMSAGSWTMSHVHPSASASSQRERRAQIDSCWCNIPDMFVDPASRAAYYWMALVTVAVVYNWIVIILRVAFEDMRDSEFHQKMFRILDTLCDVIYLLDVAIQSRTAYLEDGCLVKSLPETVRHYRSQPHFALDVLSVVPLTTVLSYLAKIGLPCPFQSGFNSLTTPALRVLRLLKYPSMTRFFEKTDSRTNNPNWLRAFRLSLHLWLVIHWIACFYYLLSQYEGLGSNDWVYPNTSEYTAFKRKYIFCMYWSTMTLTTIGERPWPVTDVEYIFTGITFLIGVFVFAAVVGNVGDVISNMNAARHDFQARMDQIKFYLNHRNIPEHLQDQIKRWAEYTWARTKAIDEHSVLQMLPSRLRTEVAIHVHLKTLKKVRIFEQCEEGLLRELVLKLKPSIYSPGEYICRIGEIGREMYIIDHGKVEILFPEHGSGQMKQVAIMMPGNYFGEISLLKLDDGQNRRTADVRSVGFSELLCLSRRDLMAALMEYPEAKKILETHARQRMLQTKRTPETESELHMYPPGHSESGHAISGSGFGPGRRSARAIFAQVMKQEGFSKLLASTANEELTEMKKILKELKDIKTQLSQTSLGEREEQSTEDLPRDDDLQQIRTQLLLETGAMVTSSDYTSASGSTLTNTADMSSESDTLISPTVAHVTHAPSGKKKSSSTRNLPLPLKPSTQYAPPDCKVALPGLTSDHPKHSAKITKTLPPFGCCVLPPDIPDPLTLLPSNASKPEGQPPRVSPRQRRSPSVPKPVDKDQQESVDLLSEGLQDTNTLLAVAQGGGGGDDPALAAVEKDSPMKDVEEQRKAMLSIQKSISSIDSCTEALSPPALLGSAVGSHSSFEFLTPSCSSAQKTQQGHKPTLQRANSEQLGMQPSSDSFKGLVSGSNSSSYTSTDYSSTTSTSSGGRGHSPKPAKPRPRYRREDLPPIYAQGNTHKEGSTNEETVSSESERSSNVMMQCKDRGDMPVDGYMSSEGFSIVSMCSSWNSSDSVKSPNTKISPGSSPTQRAATEPTDTSPESTDIKGHVCPVPPDTDTENSDCVVKEVESGENASSRPDQQDSLTECLVDTCDGIQGEQTSSQTDSCSEEQMPLGGERGAAEQIYTRQSPVPAHQTDSDSMTLKMVDSVNEDVAHLDEDDVPGNFSENSDDSNADVRGAFIAATRVKSDFDKRISEKELADMPRTVTCRKIDDTQLSILLARRREVNDSVAYIVESPGRPRHSVVDGEQLHSAHSEHSSSRLNKCSVVMEKPQSLKSEHSHSIQSVIKNTIESHCANKTAYSAQDNVMDSNTKEISDGKDACKPDEKYEPNSEMEDSMFSAESKPPFAKAVCADVLIPSADPPSQNDSKVQNVVCNETTVTEDMGSIKRDETQTTTCVSTDLQDTFSERLDETSKQCLQTIKHEVEGVGTDCSTTAEEPHATSGSKDKKYPVSILKKCRPEPQHGDWHDSTHTHLAQPPECSDSSSPVTDTQQLTASMVDDSSPSNLLLDDQKYPDTSVQAEPGAKSLVEAAYDEKCSTMKGSDSEVSDYNRDPSPVVPSAEPIPPTLTEVNQNETLTTAGQHSPASQSRGQGPETRRESDEALGTCVDTGIGHNTVTTKVEAVSPSRPSGMGCGNRPTVRRHSEKLDSLIAAFDHGMKAHEHDFRSGEQKNSVVSITETRTDTNPEKEADSKEAADKSPEECSGKPIVTDTVGDHASPRKTSSPLPLSADTEDENKLSSCTASVPAPQRRKTLRRRNAKRASNPYPRRKEQAGKDRGNVPSCEDSAEFTSSDPGTEGEISTSPKHHTENITTCVTLVKNLVWKTDCGESSVGQDREIQFSASPKEDLSPPYFREKLIGNSVSQQASSPRAPGNLLCDSEPCEGSDQVVDRDREVCAEGSTVPLSYWKEMLGSGSTTMSASERGSNRHKVSASMAEDGSRETLDRANNSTTAECSSYIGGSSPPGGYVTSYVSHFPGQPAADLVSPDTPVLDHACFEASVGRNPPTSPLRTFPVADLSPAEYLEGLSGGEVESAQRIGTVTRNRNQQNYSRSVHPNAGQSRLAAADTEEATHRSFQAGHNTDPNLGVYPEAYPTRGSDITGIQHAHPSDDPTGPSDAGPDRAAEQQQQTEPAETQQRPDSQEVARDSGANPLPPETVPQGAQAPKRLSGTGMVHALHLHPSLMDSPGASSTDESAGEGGAVEGAAEAMSSLILLADFGVEEDDDDEGALSGLSGCGDHSDINSDLDDL